MHTLELSLYDFYLTKMAFVLPQKYDNKTMYNFMFWSSDWLYIWEVLCLNLSPKATYLDWSFFAFPLSLQANGRIVLQIGPWPRYVVTFPVYYFCHFTFFTVVWAIEKASVNNWRIKKWLFELWSEPKILYLNNMNSLILLTFFFLGWRGWESNASFSTVLIRLLFIVSSRVL